MIYFKALVFAFLLLATEVLATRCTYSVKHSDIASGMPGNHNSKLAEMDQDKADSVVTNMGTWSGGKYQAKKSRAPNMIIVSGTTTSSQSNAMIQDMQHVVSVNYKARSKSPSPGPARHARRMVELPYEIDWV